MKPHDLPFPHAVAAVTHADPYPYYDALAATQGWHFDPCLEMWVAASAAMVDAVLAHADCAAPAPQPLAGADPEAARAIAERIARSVWRGGQLNAWMTCVPELAMASLADADADVCARPGLPALAYEEAAGLIGNSLLALLREPDEARSGGDDMAALVAAVSRRDPPVQNVRRIVTRDCEIGGTRLRAGQKILLVLAAASRDAGRAYGLGFGAQLGGCPHHALAGALASGALRGLLGAIEARQGPSLQAFLQTLRWRYRASSSLRIPVFD